MTKTVKLLKQPVIENKLSYLANEFRKVVECWYIHFQRGEMSPIIPGNSLKDTIDLRAKGY